MIEFEAYEVMNRLSEDVLNNGGDVNDHYEFIIGIEAYWSPTAMEAYQNGQVKVGTITSDLGLKADLVVDMRVHKDDVFLVNHDLFRKYHE